MRDFNKCDICGDYHWADASCGDVYLVFHEEYLGDDPKTIYANSFRGAGKKYAEYYNSNGDYVLMDNTIEVKIQFGDEVKKMKLSAEPSINYLAEESE